MARRLSDEINELRIEDNISGSTIVLYYRMPTTRESIGYTNGLTRRKKNKLVMNMGETRQKYGARILKGFRDGDFERMDGEYLPMASDPKSVNYCPEWKEHVMQHASDIIEALAIHVFESSVEMSSDAEAMEDDQEQGEEPSAAEAMEGGEDLEKN